jgi:hypothetical protein
MSNLVDVVGSEELQVVTVSEGALLEVGSSLSRASSSWVTARTTPDAITVLEVDHSGNLTRLTSLGGIDVVGSIKSKVTSGGEVVEVVDGGRTFSNSGHKSSEGSGSLET